MKASLVGGLAATLAAPLLFLATVIATPASDHGFWQHPSDVLFAIHAIWLFAGVITMPASLAFGPIVLATIYRWHWPPTTSAIVLGGILGAVVINLLPLIFGAANIGFSPELSAFAAAIGAVGAGVAAAWFGKLRGARSSTNAA